MKISVERLKQIIQEEVNAHVVQEKLTDKEEEEEKELKGKLKDLEHKWMKEGKLSSALQERYGINQENAVGNVLWHSLNESGQIGVYDMKFGDTIIRNLTEADLTEKEENQHPVEEAHGVQKATDPKRRKR